MKTKEFVQRLNDDRISAAIAAAESKTSGEIRVFISEVAAHEPVSVAKNHFVRLGMDKTRQRNAVLLYFAPVSQTYALIGDHGVDHLCGASFWEETTAQMRPLLQAGNFTEAVIHAVARVGEVLAAHFPRASDDRDELPNQVERD